MGKIFKHISRYLLASIMTFSMSVSVFAEHMHTWSYSVEGNKITATCNTINCTIASTSVSLNTTDITYDSNAYCKTDLFAEPEWNDSNGLVSIDPVVKYYGTGTTDYDENTNAPINVGTYSAKVKVGEYTIEKDFKIEPIHLILFALPASKDYGVTTDPELEYRITSGSIIDNATISGSLVREQGEDVGEYSIQQGTLSVSSSNYVIDYNEGIFEIMPIDPIYALPQINEWTYDAQFHNLLTGGSVSGGTFYFSRDGVTWTDDLSSISVKNAGQYNVSVKIKGDKNYKDVSPVFFSASVSKSTVSISDIVIEEKTYDGKTNAIIKSYSAEGLIEGDVEAVITANFETADAGDNKKISVDIALAGTNINNYILETESFTTYSNIKKCLLSISAVSKTKVYGESDPKLEYTPAIDPKLPVSVTLYRDNNENVGVYDILASISNDSNFILDYTPGSLTITKRPITIKANDVTKKYEERDPNLTYTHDPLVDGDDMNGVLVRDNGEEPGSYTISQGSLTPGDNYNVTFIPATLTIFKRPVPTVVPPRGHNSTYDGNEKNLITEGFAYDDKGSVGVMEYSFDGIVWYDNADDIKAKDADTYIVQYRVTSDQYHEQIDYPSYPYVTITISKADYTYTAPVTTSHTYNGEDINLIETMGEVTDGQMLYSMNSVDWTPLCNFTAADAGTYKIYYKIDGDDNHNSMPTDISDIPFVIAEISKADVVYSMPRPINCIYDGDEKILISSGNTDNGYIEYSLDKESWSINADEIKAVKAGVYTVFYRVIADKNHISFPVEGSEDYPSVSVEIKKKTPVIDLPEGLVLTYKNEEQTLINPGIVSGGVLEYSMNGEDWTINFFEIKAKEISTYTVYYRIIPDEDYDVNYDSGYPSVVCEIKKKEMSVTIPQIRDLIYNEDEQILIVPGVVEGGIIEYSTDGINWTDNVDLVTGTDAGAHIIYYRFVADDHHENIDYSAGYPFVTTIIKQKTGFDVTEPKGRDLTYNGEEQVLFDPGYSDGGIMTYSFEDDIWIDNIESIKATEVGTYSIKYKVVPDDNHYGETIYGMSVAVIKDKSNEIEEEITDYSDRYIVGLWDDVVSIDNSENLFTTYQWYKNDQLISGATKQYYQDASGLAGNSYYCIVDNGKKVGPKSFAMTPSVVLSAKGGRGTLQVTVKGASEYATISVHNSNGLRVVYAKAAEECSFPLPSGIYVVTLSEGNKRVKVVVE